MRSVPIEGVDTLRRSWGLPLVGVAAAGVSFTMEASKDAEGVVIFSRSKEWGRGGAGVSFTTPTGADAARCNAGILLNAVGVRILCRVGWALGAEVFLHFRIISWTSFVYSPSELSFNAWSWLKNDSFVAAR